jgi:uncharacterized protein (TIGR02246 family)
MNRDSTRHTASPRKPEPLAFVVVTAMVAVALPFFAPAQAAARDGESTDVAGVRALWSRLDQSWNARDAERFGQLFTEDASFGFVDRGQSLEGRATIYQHYAEQFRGFSPDLRHRTLVLDVRPVSRGVVAMDGTVKILRSEPGSGERGSVLRTFAIFAVMLQTDDSWNIRVLRAYQLPSTVEAPADR